MAKVRWNYSERKRSETGQTGTVTYDLPKAGWIPRIIVRAFSTPTASTNQATPLNKALTEIKLFDGGTPIQTWSGNQLLGALMHRVKRSHISTEINDNAVEGYEDFEIVLEHKTRTAHYCPDFSKFRNPQLSVTWDYAQTTGPFGESFDADATPSMKFTVLTKIVEGPTTYVHGYVKSERLRSFTSAASAEQKVEITGNEKLIGLMIEAGYDALDWTEDVEKIKLDFNTGQWVPLELFEEEIVPFEDSIYGAAEVDFAADIKDAIEMDTHMGFVTSVLATTTSGSGRSFEWLEGSKGIGTTQLTDVATPTAISTYETVKFHVRGLLPYQCFYIPMKALMNDTEDWVDMSAWKNVFLFITQGASVNTSSTPTVIAEYLIT